MNKSFKNTILLLIVTGLSIGLYLWFLNSIYYKGFYEWVSGNRLTFILFLFSFKVLSIVWPPLTGGVATLAAIPLLGWQTAYIIDLVGSVTGGVVAYHLGKKYGYKILKKLFDENIVERIRKIKIKKGKELEAVIIYRIIFGSTILEVIYYGAGLLRVGFGNFFIGAIISHLITGLPVYYLTNNILSGANILIVILSIVLGIPLFLYLRKRHFEL